ncbi:hypothetical protein K469DRAFT_713932 [Zopfia rhizophila CBS 207.26]|uniref:Uncharacterized protein n=1 Tax=Zopfia rhizophila CBS 207.26 TaxID=1314779 RepID=A0A6A6DSW7_9PEZI|nr:hypothetical protein K469DRAFT_713932 [Zopfia rhizophila CBS 207.26]
MASASFRTSASPGSTSIALTIASIARFSMCVAPIILKHIALLYPSLATCAFVGF